jgi:hypothetical protein
MRVEQRQWSPSEGWTGPARLDGADLVLAFGDPAAIGDPERLHEVRAAYPRAALLGCSTAGEIRETSVLDGALVATAVAFERTRVAAARVRVAGAAGSAAAGERLAAALAADGLVHVLVLSDGLGVNGSALAAGLASRLPPGVAVTGGLAGDGPRFERTLVLTDAGAEAGTVAGVGFYGDRLAVGYGSVGGWDPFGPDRVITRSRGNVLYELDGRSALELYRRYLGDHATGLPATGLLFPLSVRARDAATGVVRTILAVDERERSMTFAGDMPEGAYARLMKANVERLIDGAQGAARASHEAIGPARPDLALLISCVGRRLVLKQRVEEEVERVREVLGPRAVLAGYYSYGEISPFAPSARCELHNQTMTITTFAERG